MLLHNALLSLTAFRVSAHSCVCVRVCCQMLISSPGVSLSFLPVELYPSLQRHKLVKCTNTLEIIQQFSSSTFPRCQCCNQCAVAASRRLANDASLYSVKQTDRLYSLTHTHTQNTHNVVHSQNSALTYTKIPTSSCRNIHTHKNTPHHLQHSCFESGGEYEINIPADACVCV